jgi:hypothetical protein
MVMLGSKERVHDVTSCERLFTMTRIALQEFAASPCMLNVDFVALMHEAPAAM